MHRAACVHFSTNLRIVIQNHSVDILFNGWLVEMPTILDSLFHKVVNTTSIPIGVEGGGGVEPQSGRNLQYENFFMAKWLQFRLFSAPHVSKCSYIDAQSHQPVLK